jgi:hypothetical protein
MIIKVIHMLNRLLIILILGLGIQTISAQELVDCNMLLIDAKEAYTAGMVELVPELLLECIQTGSLTGEARKEAYKLVINSYLFDYMTEEADSLMDGFVRDFPDYREESSDPQEFVTLLEEHLLAAGIDPEQIPADTTAVVVKMNFFQRFRERPITKGAGEFGNTLGFNVGIPLTIPYTLERYRVGDPARDEGHFGMLPGFLAGAEANIILNRKLEASFGLIYDMSRFSYSATPVSLNSYRYVETEHQFLMPLSVLYKFNPENRKVCYYLRGGFIPSYLMYASGKGSRSSGEGQEELIVDPTDISSSRVHFNVDALIGGGLRIPLRNAFIFSEIRLSSRIIQTNREDMRFENNNLSWLLYHVESDFRVHKISICGGICWDLTKE